MNLFILFFLLLLSISLANASPLINEIMYDPGQCSDTVCEWLELWNDGNETVPMSSCLLNGRNLSGSIGSQEYRVVARNKPNFTAAFGNVSNLQEFPLSLSNSGSSIQLAGSCNYSFDYTPFTSLAAGNNHTLERRQDGSWGESLLSGGTPGQPNSINQLSSQYGLITITEIMPDPFGIDDAPKPEGEWVELYNPGKLGIDLKGMVLQDAFPANELIIAQNKMLYDTILCGGCYAVIYRDGDTDFTLNSEYDEVRLFSPSGVLVNNVSYSNVVEGMSWSKINGNWYLTRSTPGTQNSYTEHCDWNMEVQTPAPMAANQIGFTIRAQRLLGFSHNITVRGVIEDEFGEVVGEYAPWSNEMVATSISKSYTPRLAEGVYTLRFWLENLSCQEENNDNNQDSKVVSLSPSFKQNASFIGIRSVDDGHWGTPLLVKLDLYKGKETKQVVQAWVEKDGKTISSISKISLSDQFKAYNLTVPIQVDANCDQQIADGSATVVADGLDLHATRSTSIAGLNTQLCDQVTIIKTKEIIIKDALNSYQLVNLPASLHPGEAVRIKVQVQNTDDQNHKFTLAGYLYRGSRCYSCVDNTLSREAGAQELSVSAHEIKTADLLLLADTAMELGEYSLKVKIRKDAQKTTKDLTATILVVPWENLSVQQLDQGATVNAEKSAEEIEVHGKQLSLPPPTVLFDGKGMVVYEDNSQKAKGLIPILLIVSLGLLVIVLWRK